LELHECTATSATQLDKKNIQQNYYLVAKNDIHHSPLYILHEIEKDAVTLPCRQAVLPAFIRIFFYS
jgi:hypothetical protein